jgi:toxic protein SymE
MEKLRKKKIYTKFRSRTYDSILIPEIRLEGKWLEKLGFIQGQTVSIEQKKNKLTITIDKGHK